jgi:hypothetical protein
VGGGQPFAATFEKKPIIESRQDIQKYGSW